MCSVMVDFDHRMATYEESKGIFIWSIKGKEEDIFWVHTEVLDIVRTYSSEDKRYNNQKIVIGWQKGFVHGLRVKHWREEEDLSSI